MCSSDLHGRPIAVPNQDIVLGLYYLTLDAGREVADEQIRRFSSVEEALMALDHRDIHVHDPIEVRVAAGKRVPASAVVSAEGAQAPRIRTTAGRLILNAVFPLEEEFVNRPLLKADIGRLVDGCVRRYDRAQVERILDGLKEVGFHWATRAGVTIGVEDVTTPADKARILDRKSTV